MLSDSVWVKYCAYWNSGQTWHIQGRTELHPFPSLGCSLDAEEVKQRECGTQDYPAFERRSILNSFHPNALLAVGVWLVYSSCSDTALYGCDRADAIRRKEVEQQSPRVPVRLRLGYLAACFPCGTYGWWLCREKQLHCSVSRTAGT